MFQTLIHVFLGCVLIGYSRWGYQRGINGEGNSAVKLITPMSCILTSEWFFCCRLSAQPSLDRPELWAEYMSPDPSPRKLVYNGPVLPCTLRSPNNQNLKLPTAVSLLSSRCRNQNLEINAKSEILRWIKHTNPEPLSPTNSHHENLENSSPFRGLRTDISQKTVVGCPWYEFCYTDQQTCNIVSSGGIILSPGYRRYCWSFLLCKWMKI